jgi:hypothetical protein
MTFPSKKPTTDSLRVTILGLIEIEGQGVTAIIGGVLVVLVALGVLLLRH